MITLPRAGLVAGPAQTWGQVRLVPLLRPDCPSDLRMGARVFAPHLFDRVDVSEGTYYSYVPHALVARWTTDGTPAALDRTVLAAPGSRRPKLVLRHHRLRKREEGNTLRILPLHLAMDGFLTSWFSGPEITWEGWTKRARSRGLSPRTEWSVPGRAIPDLSEALRVFEIHPDQVGVIVLVGDIVASANVFAHPDDYRALHTRLLSDFYAEEFARWGPAPGTLPVLEAPLEGPVATLEALAAAVESHGRFLAGVAASMADLLFTQPIVLTEEYATGPFRLCRFVSTGPGERDRHIGELILRPDGTLGYLKTYRLDRDQARRFDTLAAFAANDWHPERTAAALGLTLHQLRDRLAALDLGGLLHVDGRPKG